MQYILQPPKLHGLTYHASFLSVELSCKCTPLRCSSNNLSETTIPHLLQIISPDLGSVIIALSLLHEGHNVIVSNAEFTSSISSFDLFTNILFEGTVTILFTNNICSIR